CKDELQQALTREKRDGKKIVLPLLYRRVKLPPFLEGRLYLNFSSSYLKTLAELGAFVHSIEPKRLADALLKNPVKSVNEVQVLLRTLISASAIRYLQPEKYIDIQNAFKKAGLEIASDAFKVYADREDSYPVMLVDYDFGAADRTAEGLKVLNE